jgi:hypothetical protein
MSSKPFVLTAVRRTVALAIAFGALALTSACIHVSPRVWQNGQAMTSSWQYREVLAGNANPAVLRGLYFSSDGRMVGQRSVRYTYFGHW